MRLVKVLELLLMRDAATTSSLSKVLPKFISRICSFLKKSKEGTPIGEEGNKKHNMVFVMAVQLLTV